MISIALVTGIDEPKKTINARLVKRNLLKQKETARRNKPTGLIFHLNGTAKGFSCQAHRRTRREAYLEGTLGCDMGSS